MKKMEVLKFKTSFPKREYLLKLICVISVSLSVLPLPPDFIKVLIGDSFYIIDIY